MIDWGKAQKAAEKHISYDGDPDINCPHCGKVITLGRVWFDHKTILCHAIIKAIGLHVEDIVSEVIDRIPVTGSIKKDAKCLIAVLKKNLEYHSY